MRTFGVALAAIGIAIISAWGTTRYELRQPERPLAAIISGHSSTTAAARVVVEEEETFHFGVMDVGSTKEHKFVLRNAGTSPLRLRQGNTSCKCTLSKIDQGEISPGQTCDVTLEWHPPSASPEFEQSAEIHTNDPQRPTLRLVVRGKVLEALQLAPQDLRTGEISVNEPNQFEATIWSYRDQPLEVKMTEFTSAETASFFSVITEPVGEDELKSQADARHGIRLGITIKPGLPLGPIQQNLRVHLNYDGLQPLQLPIAGRAVGDITVMGANYVKDKDYLELGNVARLQGHREKIYLLVKGPRRESIQLKVAAVDPAETMKVKLGEPSHPSAKAILWPLEIEIPPGAEPINRLGSELGKMARVTLTTGDELTPSVLVRVRVAVVED